MIIGGAQAPASSRLIVVASDLHLGPGKDSQTGQWLPIEDFRWGDDLIAFLAAIDEAGKGATDLILNGDTFELWQSTTDDCRYPDVRMGCTEAEASARFERVLAAHAAEVSALGAFARKGSNRIVLVPGDHDAALLFPSIAARAVAAWQAPGHVEVAAGGYWLSQDGAVYAEHGHQIAADPYAFASWPQPFIAREGRQHLERTTGEQVAQTFYNQYESRLPILDNVAQDGAGVKYLAATEPASIANDQVAPLLMFFLSRPTWQQFRLELDGGDVQPVEWDLSAVRRSGAAFFAESLLPDDRFRPLVDVAVKEGRLTLDPATASDDQLNALCDYRAALRRSRRRLERSMTQAHTVGRAPNECPRTAAARGSAFEYFWRSRDRLYQQRLGQIRASLGREGRPASIRVFVQGHTHLPAATLPLTRIETSPIVLNSGAWQRTVTPFQIEALMQERRWTEADVLRQLQPEHLPACYGVVWVDPYAGTPMPRLRFWRSDGRWGVLPRDAAGIATACGGGGGPAA